jgi:MoaA/NifB/PqqE/SkfB family radical SAM enzyme
MTVLKVNKIRECDLSISNRCMMKCKMCDVWKKKNTDLDDHYRLTVDEYKKIFYELREYVNDPLFMNFGGGEPLLRTDLLDIIKIGASLRFRTNFPTNGYLIDEAMAMRIADSGVSSIGISIDSLDSSIHDSLRGREGCWERAMNAVTLLKKHCSKETQVNILTIIMGKNIDGIIDLTNWVFNNPAISGVTFQALDKPPNNNSADNWYDLEEYAGLWPRGLVRLNGVMDELIALAGSHEKKYKIGNPISQLELFKKYFNDPVNFVKPGKCHLGDGVVNIDYCGYVVLCNSMEPIGNIRERPLYEIWNSAKAEETRGKIADCNRSCYFLINCSYDKEAA